MNVISKSAFVAKTLLPILAIIALLWFFSGKQNTFEAKRNHTSELNKASDYAMTNFKMTVMDINGRPSRIIMGQEMTHYPKGDSTEIILPIAKVLEPGKETWIMSSNKATTEGKGEEILLTGNVIITQENNPNIELHTEALTLDTIYNTAHTNLAVSMKSPDGYTDSVGLHAAFEDKTINLHSRVKGQYNAPPVN